MKKTIQTNYRVVVEPRRIGNLGFVHVSDSWFGDEEKISKEYYDLCNEIVENIERCITNTGSVYIESDKIDVCEFCKSYWTEDSDEYNGGCCDNDNLVRDEILSDTVHQVCNLCGDSGRSYPTLENPDGVVCDCMLSRNDP